MTRKATTNTLKIQDGSTNVACSQLTFTPGAPAPSPTPSPVPSPTPTPVPTPSPSPAHYETAYEDVTVGGYVCGTTQKARVYYPKTDQKVPVISFAHGFGGKGPRVSDYKVHHPTVAAAGFVLIHLESGSPVGECKDEWKDQMRSLEFLKSSPLGEKVDWSLPTGIMGHSMGGGATYHSAAQATYIKKHNIAAAVCYNPQIQLAGLQPITNSRVPIMFTTGTADTTIVPKGVKEAYTKTTGVTKVFANLQGGGHMEPCGPNRLTEYSIAMMDCHLKSDSAQCSKVYGSERSSLCGGKLRMKECLHENEPLDAIASAVV